MEETYRIRQVEWDDEQEQIMQIRRLVFVEEQKVSLEEEMDGLDDQCWFVLAENADGEAIGTGRLLPGGKIGRLAVLREHRNRGVGSSLLKALIAVAESVSIRDLYLHGQVQAKTFYSRHGFTEEGPVFEEAGIPHVKMRLSR